MYFGVDYYPEHWPRERWKADAKLMADAGFDTVRMGEFAWSKLEPKEGKYCFEWLDEVIDILAAEDIKVVLGTPTAAPPPWLTQKHPEVLPINKNKEIVGEGHRRHYCVNNETYRDYTRKIVARMAKQYGSDSRVIGWQVDNELGHPVCYCDTCKDKFHDWIRNKYKSLDALNKAWGTIFWSQTYTDWDQIPLPNENPRKNPNPSLHLDYKRFFSDSTIEYSNLQTDLLKQGTSNQWICHNFMGFFNNFDHFEMSENLDLATWDHYPYLRESAETVSAGHDLTYGFKNRPFWVMEEQSNHVAGGKEITPQPQPGEVRMWTYQSIGHGADGIMYFRWRTCRFGDETFWGGVLPHDGSPESPAYQEIKQVGNELNKIKEKINGTTVKSKVSILHSYEQRWSEDAYRYHSPIDYQDELMKYYSALFNANVNTAFIPENRDFERYAVLFVPLLPMVKDSLVADLEEFVKNGGVLIANFRTGIKDYNNVFTDRTLPGKLSDLFGIEIHKYTAVEGNQEIVFSGKKILDGEYPAKKWADCLQANSAEVLAEYVNGWLGKEGYAAVTKNEFGKGDAIYVGSSSTQDFYSDLINWILRSTSAEALLESDENVEVVRRSCQDKGGESLFFVMNHSNDRKKVRLDREYTDILTDKDCEDMLELEPYGVAVLE